MALRFSCPVSDISTMPLPLPLRLFASLLSPTPRVGRFGRRSTLADPSSLRVEACPPSLRQQPTAQTSGGLWQRVLFWLLAPAPHAAATPLSLLPAVRNDFMATLSDISAADADRLRQRIGHTHSLRELWHLRAEVYRVVGLAHSQSLAEQRVAQLNRHFPTRSPRSHYATQL